MTEAGWYLDPEGSDSLRYWNGSVWTDHWSERPRQADEANPRGLLEKPAPRIVRTPHEAEELAAEWCRWYGFEDVETTGHSSDGGVDVRAKGMIAQVKMLSIPVGRPDLQQLYGVAMAQRALPLFFSVGNYSREARQWAEQVGMALFGYTRGGEVEPVNSYAESIESQAERQSAIPKEPWWAYPLGCDDADAAAALLPDQGRLRRQTERIMWCRQGWLPVATIRYDFTYLAMLTGRGEQFINRRLGQLPYMQGRGRRVEERFARRRAAIELVHGYSIGVPPAAGNVVRVPFEQMNLRPRGDADRIVEMVEEAWDHYARLVQPYAQRQAFQGLARYNVPAHAETLRVTATGTFLVPYYAALIAGPSGNRIAVVEGVTGKLDEHLSSHFTRHAPDLIDEIYAGRHVGPT